MSAAVRAIAHVRPTVSTVRSVPLTVAKGGYATAASNQIKPPAKPSKSAKSTASPSPPSWEEIAHLASTPVINPPTPAEWQRPIAPGIEPAYDAALEFLRERKQRLTEQQRQVDKEAVAVANAGDTKKATELVDKAESLAIAAEVDDPATRWAFGKGWVDMSRPALRYMREQAWRRQTFLSSGNRKPIGRSHQELGPLHTLQFRAQVMKIIPDLVPFATPTADLQLFYGVGHGFGDHGGKAGEVHTGVMVPPHKSLAPPRVEATVFHPEERKYTLVMVDLDAPDEPNATYQQWVHWLVEDIPLSATQAVIDQETIMQAGGAKGKVVLPYIPPHPAQGSQKHRYATVLLTQFTPFEDGLDGDVQPQVHERPHSAAYPLEPIPDPVARAKAGQPVTNREQFSVREYMSIHGMDVAGLHFFREAWDEGAPAHAVSLVYKEILQQPEAIYEGKVHWQLPRNFKPPKP